MVSRLLFILALLHAKTDAVLEVARPRQTQPKAIRIAPPDSPTTDTRGGAVAAHVPGVARGSDSRVTLSASKAG